MPWSKRQYDFTRRTIAFRRQRRRLSEAGYIEADPTQCGWPLFDELRQNENRITDVQISTCGTKLYIKLERPRRPQAATNKLPDGLEWGPWYDVTWGETLVVPAQGIEAQSATTEGRGPKDESPVA